MTAKYDVVIIGAGLTGLTAALLLKRKGLSVLVVEKSGRPGGSIRTNEKEGYVYESGPVTASLSNIETVWLFDMLKGKCELETAREEADRRLIFRKGKLLEIPCGLVGGIRTPLFQWKDKLRLLGEPFRKAGTDPDESIASLVMRRMGKSFLDYAVQPFIGGIYAGDPERLITRLALPKLYNLEQDYGSFIKGAIQKAKQPKSEQEKRVTKKVFSVKGGLENLTKALAESAGCEHIRLNECCKVFPAVDAGWRVTLSSEEINATYIISTVGSHAAGEIFDFMPVPIRESIEKINYAKIVQAAVGVKRTEQIDTKAFGLLIPSIEKRELLGVLYPSSCFEGRAPDGKTLLSVFLGGINNPEIINKTVSGIKETVVRELNRIYGLSETDIDFIDVFKHCHAIPQYETVCDEALAGISRFERMYPGIILAGNMRDGIGIPNRIKQAFDIASAIASKSL
jgi:oxygen-dependent protoporphyrinogen oxidase